MIHGGVDEVDAAQQVVGAIEMFDEMAQAFGSVGGQMENMFKLVFSLELLHERGIRDRTPDKIHAFGNVIAKATAQIVQASHLVSRLEQMPADVRTNKARRAGDPNL